MDFQAYNKILICREPICNVAVPSEAEPQTVIGYEFYIKYPSYRGAYLSCIEQLCFTVDGEEIPAEQVYFGLNGKQFLLEELSELFKEYWFVRDKAAIRILNAKGLSPGDHKVRVFMRHRVPYTGYFGQYLVLDSDATETLTCKSICEGADEK